MVRRRTLWAVLLGALILVSCLGAVAAAWFLTDRLGSGNPVLGFGLVEATETYSRQVAISAPAVLEVDVPIGDVTVLVGDDCCVRVEAKKRAWGATQGDAQHILDDIEIEVARTGARVRVLTRGQDVSAGVRSGFRSPQVDLTIWTPQETALELTSTVGRLRAEGIRGDVSIRADIGQVTLVDVMPQEVVEVESRIAGIELQGPLADGAVYRMTSDVGRIALELPADSSFTVEARSDIGRVNVGFLLAGQSTRDGIVGENVAGEVGDRPAAQVELRSRVGEVSVQPMH